MTTVAPRLGAWPVAGDGVEFRVWAPDARTMALCLQGTQRPMPVSYTHLTLPTKA